MKICIWNNCIFAWIGVLTCLGLLVPFIAMQYSEEIDWNLFDFALAGTLVFSAGAAFVLIARRAANNRQRLAIGLVFVAALLLIWAELAVGLFGSPVSGS